MLGVFVCTVVSKVMKALLDDLPRQKQNFAEGQDKFSEPQKEASHGEGMGDRRP
jgi:hypothetical protein